MRPIDTKLETELRRGILQIAVLSLLREPRYGYALGQVLGENGLAVEEGTLYPLLRRMEEQGLLESWWLTEEARPRKYYRTTPDGEESLRVLVETWGRVDASLRRILETPVNQDAKVRPQPPAGGEGASHG